MKQRAVLLEKPRESKPTSTKIISRKAAPTLQEQINRMLRFDRYEDTRLPEDFHEGEIDTDFRSPHELVRDEETGIEMCRYEKEMLDAARPTFHEEAVKKALSKKRPASARKPAVEPQSDLESDD